MDKIKVTAVRQGPILLKPIRKGLFEIPQGTFIKVVTSEGVLYLELRDGFTTDCGSIPYAFRRFIPRIGDQKTVACYLFHDFAYTAQEKNGISRGLADSLLYKMLRLSGMGRFKAWCVYSAVNLFGGGPYEKRDKIDVHNEDRYKFYWTDKDLGGRL